MKTVFGALMAMVLVAGCETIEGAGQDIESGGEAIQQAAN